MPKTIALAEWEDTPVVIGNGEAYFDDRDQQWHLANRDELIHKAYLLQPETFHKMFGKLPPLPDDVFKGYDKKLP